MAEKNLWGQFNLAENNPDQSGGILYCLRYDIQRIEGHREAVVSALQSIGIKLKDLGETIGAASESPLTNSQQNRAHLLLEELSVLNEAQEYHEAGYGGIRNIRQLSDRLTAAYIGLLGDRELAEAYNVVTAIIPQVVGDIRSAGRAISGRDRRTLDELTDFSRRQTRQLDRPKVVLFGFR